MKLSILGVLILSISDVLQWASIVKAHSAKPSIPNLPTVIKLDHEENITFSIPPKNKASAIILMWTPYYGKQQNWAWFFRSDYMKDWCPHLKCEFTNDQGRINESDAILFHAYRKNLPLDEDFKDSVPSFRSPHHRWVFVTNEPPETIYNVSKLNGLFNWTMTYKSNSDIHMHYGKLIMTKNSLAQDSRKDYSSGKTKLVAWLVSHCHTDGKREDFVKELQKIVHVDVFGRCGPLQCEPRRSEACYNKLSSEYKFYIAFENILCKDYITEKLYNTLMKDIVPIVFSGANYDQYAPKGSYINALDFPNPEALGEYLLYLDGNDIEYNRYFDWKRGYEVKTVTMELWNCELCSKLLDATLGPHVYEDLYHWWQTDSECKYWEKTTNSTISVT